MRLLLAESGEKEAVVSVLVDRREEELSVGELFDVLGVPVVEVVISREILAVSEARLEEAGEEISVFLVKLAVSASEPLDVEAVSSTVVDQPNVELRSGVDIREASVVEIVSKSLVLLVVRMLLLASDPIVPEYLVLVSVLRASGERKVLLLSKLLRLDVEETPLNELKSVVVSREAKNVPVVPRLMVLALLTSLNVVETLLDSRLMLASTVSVLSLLPLELIFFVAATEVTEVSSESVDESELISLVDVLPLSDETDGVVDGSSDAGTATTIKPEACVPEGWIVARVTVD